MAVFIKKFEKIFDKGKSEKMASYTQEAYCPACKRNVTAPKTDVCPRCGGKVRRTTWSVRFRAFDETATREYKLTGFRTKGEATKAQIAELSKIESSALEHKARTTPLSNLTFRELYLEYLRYKKNEWKDSSYYEYQRIGELRILPTFEKRLVVQITKRDVLNWQNSLGDEGLSYKYKIKLRGFLYSIFKYAHIYYDLPANPVAAVPTIKKPSERRTMHVWTPEQFAQFYKSVDDLAWRTLFSFAYNTGCRKGEILALQWQDVDLTNNTADIHKTLTRKTTNSNTYTITASPKTQSSNRVISLPSPLVTDLVALKKIQQAKQQDYIFGGKTPLSDHIVDRRLATFCEKAGLPPLHMHEFRHSHASFLLSSGIPIVDVSKRLGHSTVTETLNTYAHVLPKKDDNICAKLETFYPNIEK